MRTCARARSPRRPTARAAGSPPTGSRRCPRPSAPNLLRRMATVREIMETDVPTVHPTDTLEDVVRTMRRHELPAIPVVNEGGRCVGMISEGDLVIRGEEADIHLPHVIELWGGVVFLESTKRYEER